MTHKGTGGRSGGTRDPAAWMAAGLGGVGRAASPPPSPVTGAAPPARRATSAAIRAISRR